MDRRDSLENTCIPTPSPVSSSPDSVADVRVHPCVGGVRSFSIEIPGDLPDARRQSVLTRIRERIAATPLGAFWCVTPQELAILNPRLTPSEISDLVATYGTGGFENNTVAVRACVVVPADAGNAGGLCPGKACSTLHRPAASAQAVVSDGTATPISEPPFGASLNGAAVSAAPARTTARRTASPRAQNPTGDAVNSHSPHGGSVTDPASLADVSLDPANPKPFYASRTIQAMAVIITGVLVRIAAKFGIAGPGVEAALNSIVGLVLTTLIPAIVAIRSRQRTVKEAAALARGDVVTATPDSSAEIAKTSRIGAFVLLGLTVAMSMLVGVSAIGCTPGQTYTTADRATFDAIAPEYRSYVENDSNLTPEQKARRARTIDTWSQRTRATTLPSLPGN